MWFSMPIGGSLEKGDKGRGTKHAKIRSIVWKL